jgi:hypothetical protein
MEVPVGLNYHTHLLHTFAVLEDAAEAETVEAAAVVVAAVVVLPSSDVDISHSSHRRDCR